MLSNLHVKNMALIEEAEVDFEEGLNILTGETGAGKSIIIGSVNIALGGKVSKDMIRHGAEFALVELVFQTESPEVRRFMEEHELEWDEGQIIISRKITGSKNVTKVNGETVSTAILRELASLLIQIHGQHDNEVLLKTSKHLELLDAYGGKELLKLKETVRQEYLEYRRIQEKLDTFTADEEGRRREISFLEFELQEIEEANLQQGEDEELEVEYRRMANAEKIVGGLSEVYAMMDGEMGSMREQIGRSLKILQDLMPYEEKIEGFYQSFSDIEALFTDSARELSAYMEDTQFDGERFDYVAKRLDFINRLKRKYGKTLEDIASHRKETEEKLEFYRNFEEEKEKTEAALQEKENVLIQVSDELTAKRKEAAKALQQQLIRALQDLNFLEVHFEVAFEKQKNFTANGNDNVSFLISTNPGEGLKPLAKIASGGELSRIMLGFKSILAGKDEMESLIFDEIDTGISGRTAQMVSEKLQDISKGHQVICITHLPQIASMADKHFLIEKSVQNGQTTTEIHALSDEKSVEELARMLGGAKITDAVLESAWEMKKMNQIVKGSGKKVEKNSDL